jgi:thioredoxin 2
MADRIFRCDRCGAFNRIGLVYVPGRLATCGKCKETLDVTGAPSHLAPGSFDAARSSSPVPLLVDFWAPWCGPCRAMAPALEQLGHDLAGRVVVAKLNTDEDPGPSQALGIQGIPTLILFRSGREVDRLVGARPLSELRAFVERAALSVAP